MPIDEQEFKKRKRQADQARQERDKAAGQLEAAMERLDDEFGCKTLEAADKKATKLTKEATKAKETYDAAVEAFDEEWAEYVED